MKFTVIILVILVFTAMGQTPFEFALVQELVQGTPHISIIRIAIDYGAPEPGRTELEIALRGAVTFTGDICIYPDSTMHDNLNLIGRAEYSGEISTVLTDRFFEVLFGCLDDFPGMNITDLALDVVSPDGLSWLALESPLSRIDSLQNGEMNRTDFWKGVSLREIEVATGGFTSMYEIPSAIIQPSVDTIPQNDIVIPLVSSVQPWKSLILPGWGQISSGNGFGWINIVIEAGGAALLISGETQIGCAVLSVNHIISFFDLF